LQLAKELKVPLHEVEADAIIDLSQGEIKNKFLTSD